ncbi:MAG TPA: cytochrome c-type biogenesis protein CcmH [Acidimicrobiales bacterium]|nr:cytochrome c-type biogenesis protein CcmH [Acidimicrobiales bacterium]
MAAVLAVALVVGAGGDRGPRSDSERIAAIAAEVRCPTCRGLSAAESDARAAQAVREEIRSRVRSGQGDDAIRAFLVSRYGRDILLKPEAGGVAGLVWMLPVAAAVLALAGLSAAFARWRRMGQGAPPSDEDRVLVELELRR